MSPKRKRGCSDAIKASSLVRAVCSEAPRFAIMRGMSELPLVLVTEGSDPKPLAWLQERARVVEAAPGSVAYDAALRDVVGMVVRTYTRIDAALLARCPKLKVV